MLPTRLRAILHARTPVRAVFANRTLARLLIAYTGSVIAEWALWVALLVFAYEHGGPTTAGVAAVALLVPSAFVAPWAGRAADGPHPGRILAIVYVIQASSLTATAILAATGSRPALVLVFAAVTINAVTFIRPSISVIAPGLIVTPSDLVAVNLLTGNADSLSVLVGPFLASVILAVGGPALVFAGCAALSVGCALLCWPLARRSAQPISGPATRRGGRMRALLSLARTMSTHRGAVELLIALGGQYALVGSLDLLYVDLAFGPLHLGSSGSGYLGAMFGVGAVLGGLAMMLVIARRRLAPLLIGSLFVIGVAMSAMGAHTTLTVALIVLGVTGLSRSMLDVTGRMLLQRSAPQESLASTFAVLEVVAGLGHVSGLLLVQILVTVGGVRAGLLGVGILFLAVGAATAPGLRFADEHADAPVVEIRLLRMVPLFAALPGPELEQLARASATIECSAGDTVVAEGEIGDRYYVIMDGEVEVSICGEVIRTMTRGRGFGEIALLAGVPRSATVTARTRTAMLTIDRASFLGTVVGHDASARVAWAVAREWQPTLAADEQRIDRRGQRRNDP